MTPLVLENHAPPLRLEAQPGPPALRTSVLRDRAAIEALAPEWNPLLERSAADGVFLTWEWMQSWLDAAGGAVRPLVVTARDERGGLVGLAPLYATRLTLAGLVRYRALRLLGDDQSGSEYADWIVDPRREEESTHALASALVRDGGPWDCLWLPRVSGWTGARRRLAEPFARLGLHVRERPAVFSAVELPAEHAAYLRLLPTKTRSGLLRKTRDTLAGGSQFAECRSEPDRTAFLDALFALNHRRWSAAGQVGTFVRKPFEARFYRAFSRRALERGWLRLYALRAGSDFQAVQIGYAYRGTFHQLQEGFDPEASSGAGNVLRGLVIERCIEEGLTAYDFLGGFTEHKKRWQARPRPGCDLFIGRRSLKNALVFRAGLWPTGRYLRVAHPLSAPSADGAAGRDASGG
jgi:CelD/BcsL family acetyltransferase involved in cellulose biosynthesis